MMRGLAVYLMFGAGIWLVGDFASDGLRKAIAFHKARVRSRGELYAAVIITVAIMIVTWPRVLAVILRGERQ